MRWWGGGVVMEGFVFHHLTTPPPHHLTTPLPSWSPVQDVDVETVRFLLAAGVSHHDDHVLLASGEQQWYAPRPSCVPFVFLKKRCSRPLRANDLHLGLWL